MLEFWLAPKSTTLDQGVYAADSVYQRAAMQQLSANVSKLSFEYLHIYSPKSGDFAGKIAKLHH